LTIDRNAALAAAAAADWPPSSSITSGLVYSMLAVGIMVGPVVCGALYDLTGSYNWGFWFASIFCAASAAIAMALVPQAHDCTSRCGNTFSCECLCSPSFVGSGSIRRPADDEVIVSQNTCLDRSSISEPVLPLEPPSLAGGSHV